MNIKDFFARSATGLGGASVRRAAMALLVTVLTATTAWATTIDGVSYIDENGVAQTANGVTVLEGGGATTLSAGWYVVTATDWYTLDGRRFSGKLTKSGVYVKGGKKFIIK